LFTLPDFLSSDCFYFEACGRLRGEKAREWKRPLSKIARVRLPRGNAYLRLLRGGDPPGHFHIDLAIVRYFPNSRPEINSTRGEIIQEVSRQFGQTLDVLVFGQYVTLVNDIPPGSGVVFAGSGAVVSVINNATVEVGGAHLVFRNEEFVRTIDWEIFKKDTVFVDIVARRELEVSPSYLVDLFRRLENAHATYILGRTGDASAPS
jgi:hypothetical protein